MLTDLHAVHLSSGAVHDFGARKPWEDLRMGDKQAIVECSQTPQLLRQAHRRQKAQASRGW